MAQRLLYPVAQMLTTAAATGPERPTGMVLLTVQPRTLGQRLKRTIGESKEPEAEAAAEAVGEPELDAAGLGWAEGPEGHEPEGDRPPASVAISPAPAADPLMPPDLVVSVQVRQGRPANEILTCARELQAGLIAVGWHGKGAARELLMGSVSAAIARYAPCHVLVARSAAERPPEALTWRHVLVVVSGSEATQQAIALTRQLIPLGIRRITLLCVQPPLNSHYLFGPFAAPTPNWQLTQSLQQAQKEQSEQMVQQAEAALHGPDVELQTLVQMSEPGPLICQIAEQQQADIVILGSDASRRLRRLERSAGPRTIRLSPTGDYVMHHAPCPVLLCRAQGSTVDDWQAASSQSQLTWSAAGMPGTV